MTCPSNLQQLQMRRKRKIRTKTTTPTKITTNALAGDIIHIQGIGDYNVGGSGLTTGPVDWQQQQSVDFPCYWVANSNTV